MKTNPYKYLLSLALGLLCLMPAMSAMAQSFPAGPFLPGVTQLIPGGDYQTTCTNISLRGNVLGAMCQRANGVSVYTELRDPLDCGGNIRNINGSLVCEDARNLPFGNYQGSCTNMYMSGNDLLALCRRADGSYAQTRLSNAGACRNNIGNNNGILVCESGPQPPAPVPGLPFGSYQDTCYNASMQGGTLVAMCRQANGDYVQSRLNNANICRTNISNNNGNLVCDPGPQPAPTPSLPFGNYQNTCNSISMQGNVLSAMCRQDNGGYVRSELRHANNCATNISNINGTLVCDLSPQELANLPAGSYQNTCYGMAMQGNTLSAMCRQANGNYVRSELRNAASCRGQITNENGVLTCFAAPTPTPAPGPTTLPQGNYASTCRDISARNNQLTATCPRANGAWLTTSTYFGPTSYISNCDGTLLDARVCPGAQPRPARDPLEQLVQDSINSIFNNIFQQQQR